MDLSIAQKLNDSKERIDINNHFKVVAGPGAGKTTFLVNHIGNIIESSDKISDLRKVACITYTNVGTESIIKKLDKVKDYVEVSTIHSFLYKNIVKPYLWILNNEYEFDLINIDGHDEIIPSFSILQEWKQNTKQFQLKDNAKLAVVLSKLHWSFDKKELKLGFKNQWEGKVGTYSIRKNSYLEYKKICWRKSLLSHDDILFLSYSILQKNDRVLEIIRGKFPYLLIDEFQDTNPIQTEIVKLIAKKETIVGVIGDECQSIYSFQGADVTQFTRFDLENIKTYYIEDNRRSTEEILIVLNTMRNDKSFHQKSPDNKHGNKPQIIVGQFFDAYNRTFQLCNGEKLYTLSFKNELSNLVQFGIENYFTDDITNEFLFSDGERGKMIFYSIQAMEYCRQNKFKDALKQMKKAYKKTENFDNKKAMQNIKRLFDNYEDICKLDIKEFYNNYLLGYYNTKGKITSGKANNYYKELTYNKVACVINIVDDDSLFRTIHKAKGDEFKNVLLLLQPSEIFDEENELSFLLKPDMNDESHRVYYVALSRAKQNLFISVPTLSKENREKLQCFDIIDL